MVEVHESFVIDVVFVVWRESERRGRRSSWVEDMLVAYASSWAWHMWIASCCELIGCKVEVGGVSKSMFAKME